MPAQSTSHTFSRDSRLLPLALRNTSEKVINATPIRCSGLQCGLSSLYLARLLFILLLQEKRASSKKRSICMQADRSKTINS